MRNERAWRGGESSRSKARPGGTLVEVALPGNIAALLLNLLVFFDQSVADRDDAMRGGRDVVLVRHENNGVALFMELFEEVHDVVTCRRIESAGCFVGKQNRRMI